MSEAIALEHDTARLHSLTYREITAFIRGSVKMDDEVLVM